VNVRPPTCLAWAIAGCLLLAPSTRAASIVVTVHPLALLLAELAPERIDVHVLVPPGASPHAFEPRPSDLVRIAAADLFLKVGGGLDDWAARLAKTAAGARPAVSVFARLAYEPTPHDHAAHHDIEHDPHQWLDPIAVRDEIAPALAALLVAIDPDAAPHYRARLADFRARLLALDHELRTLLAGQPRRYVAFHNAWRHFAARYDLKELAVVQEAAGEQPTPRELANLVRKARAARLRAILIEPQLDPRLARTLGESFAGVTVLVDPLGDPQDPERSTYEGLLRFNARAFRAAMNTASTSLPSERTSP